MAPSRRAQENGHPPHADDTDNSDVERPRAYRHAHRKRLSEAYSDADASFASDGRAPLVAVNINDDAAEKRRRRKSTKITAIEEIRGGPSAEGSNDADGLEATRGAKQKQQLNAVAPPPVINVPLDVMNSNFEEWMRMATDNKINAANSWSFALIDYFHDMSLLRNNDDNSINFQRASCTLDGCVKIWTSRVDSVGNETGKLLSNLTDGRDEDEDENDPDNPADPSQARKRAHRPTATLAKDPSQLRSKKLDLEFNVDPLFRKTCADFDEGGAQGLLMNHLSLGVGSDSALRIVFDGGDQMGTQEDDQVDIEPEHEVDLTFLCTRFLPDLAVLEDKAIAHSLADFSFSKNSFNLDEVSMFQDRTQMDDDDDDEPGNDGFVGGDAPVEDFFVGADAVADDYGGDMGMGGGDYGDQGSNGSAPPESAEARSGPYVAFDPRRAPNERDFVMALTEGDADGGMMDYFDQNFLKNWAGPEHWKLRKVIRRPETDANANKGTKVRKEKKEAFKIDFSTPASKSLKELSKELFAPVTKGAGINLPGTGFTSKRSRKKTQDKEKRDDHRLPDDMHFSSRQLVTLFLKPKFYLKMRGQKVRFNESGDGEVDENFWAQAAAGQAGNGAEQDGEDPSGAVPFNTQFFHDDYDDGPGFDDGDDGDGPDVPDAGEQDLLAATQGQKRKIRPETVNYAKRAKRVDVRKLKENIWKGLDIVVAPQHEAEDSMDVDQPSANLTDPNEARTFGTVINGLQRAYPREKMEEISTSFCFICLLHLANEQGLKLESNTVIVHEDNGDNDLAEQKVGDIWDLKARRQTGHYFVFLSDGRCIETPTLPILHDNL
ncbi:hypothetical protein AX16_001439 [Volvariella volvacea WC 439]|nr:hypothetical protein AX16_001439 [Volvariella volvacea WC 439]